MLRTQRSLRGPVGLVLAAVALLALTIPSAADAAKKKPRGQKTTKIHHVGSFVDSPGSAVSFTLVKKGRTLVRATNIRITANLWCREGAVAGYRPYTFDFPDTKILRNRTSIGFAIEDMPLVEYEWGFKRIFGLLTHGGRRASGDARLRFEHGALGCGGMPVDWTSQAQ